MDRFGHTQEKVAEALGKSRSHIANTLRLLNLAPDILVYLRDGRISAGHARALLTADDPAALARRILDEGLSVRETEKLAKAPVQTTPKGRAAGQSAKDADTRMLEQRPLRQSGHDRHHRSPTPGGEGRKSPSATLSSRISTGSALPALSAGT
jgi:ParB-like chromosome segregation protein Spo0J